jgi:cobalt-zinc-cadmium efflux system membrane fusion protein
MAMKSILFIIPAFFVLTNCSLKKEEDKEVKNISPRFSIPDSLMNQVKTDTVAYKPVYNELKLIGKITFDQDKVVRIYPLVSGNVVDVKVSLGSHVEKGQVLAVIRSSEVAGVENDLVTARSNLAVAEKNYAAASDMYKSGILSEKDYTTAQYELEKAKSELNKANTIISIYGSNTQSGYVIKAPISGFVVEKFVNPNMQIRQDNGTNLFTISDLKHVWVLANVYESDIENITENENADISTISYPDKIFHGKLDKIYNVLDPDNKTMKVQIQLDNKDYLLKPEMFATVMVHQVTGQKMLALPANAVIFDRNQYWALVYNNKCNIETRKLDIVTSNTTNTYVRSGIKEGEKVITNRQLIIYNAINQ